MTRWKRECREVGEAVADVERESSELGEILDDPSKTAMKKAKMEVRFFQCLTLVSSIEHFLQILQSF